MLATFLFGLISCLVISDVSGSDFYYVGEFDITSPAFVEMMYLSANEPNRLDLVVTHFSAFGKQGVNAVLDIGSQLDNIRNGNGVTITSLIDKTLQWPNFVYIAEPGLFQKDDPSLTTLLIHDGFLVPMHENGGVYALLLENDAYSSMVELTPTKRGNKCYYHNSTIEFDLDGDGRKDMLCARTCDTSDGELVWLKQPSDNALNEWTLQSLIAGPDILINAEPYNDSTLIVYTAQFWAKKLAYYYLTLGVNGNPPTISDAFIIDDTIGAAYDVQIVDLLKNGNRQLLVNNHEADGSINGVFVYEFPTADGDGASSQWTKHKIAGQFNTTGGTGVGAPGFVYPYDLKVGSTEPYRIAIAGDGNYFAWDLVPQFTGDKSESNASWTYDKEMIMAVGGTVGSLGIADVNGDGFVEMFIPYYEKSKMYVYTANPNF